MLARAACAVRAHQSRALATFASPIDAVKNGDLEGAKAAFPGFLAEYRRVVVPEPELAGIKSGRFDKFLRLLGSKDGEDWSRFLAAAVVDLRDQDPAVCQSGTIINAMIFASLCEVLPPQQMGMHLMAVQVEGTSIFQEGEIPSAENPMGSVESMDEARKTRAMAHDAVFRSWYHGMFMGGRGSFDGILKNARDRVVEHHEEAIARAGPDDDQMREHARASIEDTKRVIFPGEDPAMRPPLAELPLLGIDASVEEFMDAIVAGHFYTFFALNPETAELARRVALFRRVELGDLPADAAPSIGGFPGATPGRVARGSAMLLGLSTVQSVIQALWVHASAVPDSPALDRLAEMASRWSHHGRRTLIVQGRLPPSLEPMALKTKMEGSDAMAWRVPCEVPAAGQAMSELERNPFGLQFVAMGPPVDAVSPYESAWGPADNVEDVMSVATSRLAAQSFMSNSVRLGSTVSDYLAGEVQRLHEAVRGVEGSAAASLTDAFGPDPGRDAGPAVEALLEPSTDLQRWAVLTGTVGPGCIAAYHSAGMLSQKGEGDGDRA